ncbi:xanthine dehydrogenase molybdenum-binding subunit [Anaerolineales bacterium]|nr:xanthine dehydrogenase molybdenum-binding subunit [Anaerolineales bacterium]
MLKKLLTINGINKTVVVDPEATLADVLRKQLFLTGTKVSCNEGHCGACSVILDGKLVRSCIVKMKKVEDGANVTTVEGVGTPQNLHPIQKAMVFHGAAQCGFCIPGFVVSSKVLLDNNPSPTREEVRTWFQKNLNACRCTGYKPIVDSVMDAAAVMRGDQPADSIEFKLPEDKRIWGTKYPRPSAVAKVTGTAEYGADLALQLPAGTLQLALVQAKVSHANILSIDTSEAEKMPGVAKVVTYKDVKGRNRINGLVTFPTNKCDGWDRPILCDTKVFQYGDAIAIVCADTKEQALAAVEKVKVELEVLPAYMSAPAAMAEDAIEIHPGTPNVYFEQGVVKGEDTKPIMESAAYVVEDSFYTQRQPHLALESDMGFAYYDEDGRLTIHSKSIAVYLHAIMIAEGLGLDPAQIRMVQNTAGGTFGYKFCPTIEALLGAACMATNRPVYLEYDYEQFITYTGKRSPFFMNIKFGADKNGKLLAMETDWSVDHGAYSEFGDLLTHKGAQFMGAGYDIPNIRGLGRTVCTNHAWGAPYRGYGSPQSEFASESLMDELAVKIGADPLELRYLNAYRPGCTTPTGQTPETHSLEAMIDLLRPKYKAAKEKAAQATTPEKKKGVGVAIGIYGAGGDGPDTAEVWADMLKDGVLISTTWGDHGQGADAGALGTAHEALLPLGVAPEKIRLELCDTGKAPDGGPAGGSRSQVVIGNAIKVCCDNLLDGIRKPDGSYMTYDEVVAAGLPTHYTGRWTSPAAIGDPDTGQGNPIDNYMYGVFMSEVTVDTKTGKVVVDKMTIVANVGKINNKAVVDGQIYGGISQGIGYALTEDFEDIHKHTNMVKCGIPFAKDVPDDIEIIYYDDPRKTGPFGASGVGELPNTAPHAAIINAVYWATGARVRELPAYPHKVLAALAEVK